MSDCYPERGEGASPMALVVQCFIKADTLAALLGSVTRCRGASGVHLILWSDSPRNSRAESRYTPLHTEVEALLSRFVMAESGRFLSITRQSNPVNLGTCKTCETALNFAFVRHQFVIFAEDDCVFARDALEWFDAMRRSALFQQRHMWAITGEAVAFVSAAQHVPEQQVVRARTAARRAKLDTYYQTLGFVPSTCFATTREKWAEFGSTRGQPLGDVDVCKRCQVEGRNTILPLVARVKDTGMLHEHGYSVFHHSAAAIPDSKQTYLMSDELGLGAPLGMAEYQDGNALAAFLQGGAAESHDHVLGSDRELQDELASITRADEATRGEERVAARRRAPARAYELCQARHERWPRTTLAIFERYRERFPDNGWWLIGRFLALAGHGREVISWMVQLAQSRPDNAEVQACASMVACEIEDRAVAERYAQAALALEPDHPTWQWLVRRSAELPEQVPSSQVDTR